MKGMLSHASSYETGYEVSQRLGLTIPTVIRLDQGVEFNSLSIPLTFQG